MVPPIRITPPPWLTGCRRRLLLRSVTPPFEQFPSFIILHSHLHLHRRSTHRTTIMWSSDRSQGKAQDTAQDAQPTAVPAPKHRHKHHVQPDGTRVWEDEKTWEDEGGKGWGRVWVKRWERGPNKEKEQEQVQTGNGKRCVYACMHVNSC